jgi:PAS domain S-box-containing protein
MVKARRKDSPTNDPEATREENVRLRATLAEREHMVQVIRESEEALRLALQQVEMILDHADDEIVAVDLSGIVIHVNRKMEEMFGYSRDDVVGTNFIDAGVFSHYTQREKDDLARDFLSMTKLEHPPPTETELVRKDGSPIFVEVGSKLLKRDGQVWGVVFTIRNISERKKTEERLRDLYAEEKEVRQRIETDMKRRVEFTRAVAHELKTPLTPIMASIDTLTSELKDERSLRLAKSISKGASTLDKRIDELLDLARGEVGMLQLRLELVDLRPMLQTVADGMTPLALSNGLSLVVHLPLSLPRVRADVTRMEQVITNLLHNAIKFTPRGGKITLGARDQGANVVFEVKDTGSGISRRQKERVFEPYHGLGSSEGQSAGMGLGLALCKMFVELHGGQIWVKSRLGKGSIFGLSLPVEAAGDTASRPETPAKSLKVLVIEDDPEIVNSLGLALEKEWSQVALLSTKMGSEGADLVESERPDIVVLDLSLPDMHGLDVLQEIRLFSSVPIVVLTVSQEERDITRSLGLGANDYVTKPFRTKELMARLKAQLRRQTPSGEAGPIVCGSLSLDPSTFEVKYGSRAISLTAIEGRILQELMTNAGQVVTHDRLADAVWGEDHPGTLVTIRTHIRRLRQKLQLNPSDPKLIFAKAGIGYSMARLA